MQGADEATRHRAEYVLTEAWRTIQRIVTNYSKLRATFEAVNNLNKVLLRRRIVELFKSTQNKVAKTFLFGSTFIKSHHHVYSPSPAAQHQQTPPSRPYCLCIITPSPHALHEQKKCAAPHLSSIISVCWPRRELNPRPPDLESVALPTELLSRYSPEKSSQQQQQQQQQQ